MTMPPAPQESPWSAVSWGAVFAGALVASTATLSLLFLCVGIGLTLVSPWTGQSASGATIGLSSGIGLVLVQWISAAFGGFVTGRLRTRWVGIHDNEVFFRDTANGLLAWCLSTLVVVLCLAAAATSIVRTGAQAVGAATAQASREAAPSMTDPTGYLVDTLFRTTGPTSQATGDPRAEVTRIFVNAATSGEMPVADKTYLAQMVAQRTGLSQQDAERRVDDVVAKARAATTAAKEAADKARKATATASLLFFLSLLVGAFIACVAAALGASYRDDVPLAVEAKGL
jgi:hypothetical protein